MCGFCGFYSIYEDIVNLDILKKMTGSLHHRGPDEEGYFLENGVALGHRRLSIIDIEGGRQPLFSKDGRFVVVYNGEIYNYLELKSLLEEKGVTFKTNSDTEVLLNLYINFGRDFFKHLRGMFSFVIYDRFEKKLFFARDRLGKKPFFYYLDGGKGIFVFGSEIKAILKNPYVVKELNEGEVLNYLKFRYIPAPETFFKGIKKLLPGYFGEVGPDLGLNMKKFWEVPPQLNVPKRFGEAVEIIETEIKKSVKLRLRSDVGFGAFLSGGVDSSLVVALMHEFGVNPLKTFSVGFDLKGSELPFARKISKYFGTEHSEVILKPNDYPENIEKLVYFRDAPITEPADIPIYMMSKMASESVKMVLTGEGSDEIFGGYPKYIYDRFSFLFSFFPSLLLKKISHNLPYGLRRLKVALNSFSNKDDFKRHLSWFFTTSNEEILKILNPSFIRERDFRGDLFIKDVDGIEGDNLYKMLYLDLKLWLPDNLLERGDRMTMGASIEARCPFMDNVLVERAMVLPSKFKVRKLEGKYILKKIAEKYLPREIIYRKKRGFPTPIDNWFKSELKDWVLEIIGKKSGRIYKYVSEEYVSRILDDHFEEKKNRFREIWTLLNFEIFLEKNFIQN